MEIDDIWDDDEDMQRFYAPSFDASQVAKIGDELQCDIRTPVPHTISMIIETPAAAMYASELLADKASGWRLVKPNGLG